jgi:hypothetical protein
MFGLKPTPQRFWKWFVANEDELFDFEKDQERVFNKLASKMRQIEPNLVFELGPKTPTGRDFVVSASGIKSAFPAITSLVGAAPKLDRWNIIAFRPRRSPIMQLELKGKKADPESIQFSLIDNGENVGILLFLPDYQEQDITWREIGYLLLDEALGEFDVETKVGPIRFFARDNPVKEERFPLISLPEIFDRHILTLQRRNGIQPKQPN